MADTTNMYIDSLDTNGKKVQRSITNLNPDATNNQLRALAIGINALSTNTFGSATKVERTELNQQTPRTLSLNMEEFFDFEDGSYSVPINGASDNEGYWYVTNISKNGISVACEVGITVQPGNSTDPYLVIISNAKSGTVSGTIHVSEYTAPNGTVYAPASLDFSLKLEDATK